VTSAAYRENYGLIAWSEPPIPRRVVIPPARSDLPAPRLARDTMDPVQSQVTGKMYDSKSALRAEYRRMGAEEVGNDPARFRPRERPKPDRKAIRDTLERAEARFNRGERAAR
jgi:hypothetical protein